MKEKASLQMLVWNLLATEETTLSAGFQFLPMHEREQHIEMMTLIISLLQHGMEDYRP